MTAFPHIDAGEADFTPFSEGVVDRSQSLNALAWMRFRKNRMALFSLAVFVSCALGAVAAPLLTPYSPTAIDLHNIQSDGGANLHHLLGTDGVGRDVLTRILFGMRAPLLVAIFGAVGCTLIGAITGLLAGLVGGWVDEALSRLTEIVFVVPGLLLIILCTELFGDALDGQLGIAGRYVLITLFIATDNWPVIMRLARGEALYLRDAPYIDAARVSGGGTWVLVRRHLLPNMAGILLVQGAFLVTGFIFITATLSVIGLSPPPQIPDIGHMLVDGASMWDYNPIGLWAPCVTLCALIFTTMFIADGLRDAFDPRTH